MQAKKRLFSIPFYNRFKKHKCPKCGAILDIIKVKKVVNSKSDDASNFDFQNVDTFFGGNVEFTWDEFRCNQCNFQANIREMKLIEKDERIKRKNEYQ